MKRLCVAVAIALSTVAFHAGSVLAQTYPSKPVRLVVPFAAGGAVDVLARLLASKLTESIGQTLVVENRPGAGGNIAADAVAKAPPDGYTILQNTNGQAISPALYRNLPFDAVKDFAPVTQLVASNLVLVASPKTGIASLAQLIALGKAKPGSLSYGSSGVGNPLHLTMEMLKRAGADRGRAIARAGGDHAAPLGHASRRAHGRGGRASRLCLDELAGLVRAGGDAARDRRLHPAGNRQGARRARRARAPQGDG